MKLIDRLESRLRPYAVPNVTAGLIAIQVVVYFISMSRPEFGDSCVLIREKVLGGEVWRLISFLFVPPQTHFIFAFFFWYLFFLMGTALEHQWGAVRYNLYLLIGYVANVTLAMLVPTLPASNLFLYGSVFLAFAQLYPDFTLNLYFVLPIKIKWLAWIMWLSYGWQFLMGGWMARLLVSASVANFLLFFGRSIYDHVVRGQRRMVRKSQEVQQKLRPRHTCTVCGVHSLTDPKMQFRYCSKCEGHLCYCENHLRTHEHVTADDKQNQPQ